MTRTDRKKLAKAARELASEYAEERGPVLHSDSWCGCVSALVLDRAMVNNNTPGAGLSEPWPAQRLDMAFDGLLSEATAMQEDGDPSAFMEPVPGAVVFPLLYVADELESQS